MTEIELLARRHLKQKKIIEKKHSSLDIHTYVRRHYRLMFAIDIPVPERRSLTSTSVLAKEIGKEARVIHNAVDECKNEGQMVKSNESMKGMHQGCYEFCNKYCLIRDALDCAFSAMMLQIARR